MKILSLTASGARGLSFQWRELQSALVAHKIQDCSKTAHVPRVRKEVSITRGFSNVKNALLIDSREVIWAFVIVAQLVHSPGQVLRLALHAQGDKHLLHLVTRAGLVLRAVNTAQAQRGAGDAFSVTLNRMKGFKVVTSAILGGQMLLVRLVWDKWQDRSCC